MAGAKRQPLAAVTAIVEEAPSYGFFQAVQLMHRLVPGSVPVGENGPAASEAIRFRQDPSLSFPTGDISSIKTQRSSAGTDQFVVTTTFLGLLGTSSPLATGMTEDLLRGDAEESAAAIALYDLFHHRVLSLYFRAWKKYRFDASFRRDGGDRFTPRALAFVGLDMRATPPKRGLPPADQLALAPLLALRTRPSRTLQIVLERLFPGTHVEIVPFVARRIEIEPVQRVQLGVANCKLDVDFAVGKSVEDRSGTFRVVIGPLGYEAFEAFIPGGRLHARLRQIIEQFSGGVLQPEVELQVAPEVAPRFELGGPRGTRLGVGSQLAGKRTKPMRVRITLSDRFEHARAKIIDDDAEG
jgi:type VI secretion system protein ImpH